MMRLLWKLLCAALPPLPGVRPYAEWLEVEKSIDADGVTHWIIHDKWLT